MDVHLLDDGFQHLALARDIDIVALDTTQEISDRALLPAGRLREPSSALKRADCVILTRVELGDPEPLEKQVRQINPRAQIFHSMTKLDHLVDIGSGRIYPPKAFEGEPVLAFCGIGNPKAFFANLRKWGFSVIGEQAFPDHHGYSDNDMALILLLAEEFKKHDVKAWVTTEKDAMNLPAATKGDIPIVACVIESSICEEQAFEEWLFARLPAGGKAA